jgi:hypothetical protein
MLLFSTVSGCRRSNGVHYRRRTGAVRGLPAAVGEDDSASIIQDKIAAKLGNVGSGQTEGSATPNSSDVHHETPPAPEFAEAAPLQAESPVCAPGRITQKRKWDMLSVREKGSALR